MRIKETDTQVEAGMMEEEEAGEVKEGVGSGGGGRGGRRGLVSR